MKLCLGLCKGLCLALAAGLLLFLFWVGLPGAGSAHCFAPLCCSVITVALAMAIALPPALICGWTLRTGTGGMALALRTASALPSVLYGLLGLGLFVKGLHLGWSMLSGILTLSIMGFAPLAEGCMAAFNQLPRDLNTATLALGLEEPQRFCLHVRQAAGALLARLCLLFSRLLGESAALLLTAGTVYGLPQSLLSSGRGLSVHILLLVQEQGDGHGAAFACLVLLLAVALPALAAKKLQKSRRT